MARIERQKTENKNGKSSKNIGDSRRNLYERELPEFLIRYFGSERLKNLNLKETPLIGHYRRD